MPKGAQRQDAQRRPTIDTARETMTKMGMRPDRWGGYSVGDYRLKFLARCIRIEKRYGTGGERWSRRVKTLFYSRIAPGQLEGIVNLIKNKGGHNHGEEKSDS